MTPEGSEQSSITAATVLLLAPFFLGTFRLFFAPVLARGSVLVAWLLVSDLIGESVEVYVDLIFFDCVFVLRPAFFEMLVRLALLLAILS